MASTESEAGERFPAPELTLPGPDAERPLDLAAGAQRKKEKLPSPSERLEARVDSYIAELKRDKVHFQTEVHRLRIHEIHHLRDDVRWLEDFVSWQSQTLAKLRTSYEWAIAFNWLSLALIAVGGCVVSYAAFIPSRSDIQQIIATVGFVGLLIGVGVQAMISYQGTKSLLKITGPSSVNPRPSPNPHAPSVTRIEADPS
jgi:hypothetical protein